MDVVEDGQFRKGKKRSIKRHQDQTKLEEIIIKLLNGEKLPEKYHDHKLQGSYDDCRECHIESDWLLIYKIDGDILRLIRTGSHADLFG